jgi:Leucine-rich repeat (LRR) protein
MKIKELKLLLYGWLLLPAVTACVGETVRIVVDGDDELSGTYQAELKAYPENGQISFRATAQTVTVNWGDGSKDSFTPGGVEQEYTHSYDNQNFRTVSVRATGLSHFGCYKYSTTSQTRGVVHELRFSEASQLTEITCNSQKLTVLDVSECNALSRLDCSGNLITELNLQNCTKLTELVCYNNQLTAIDLTKCTQLQRVACPGNQLTGLNVSGLRQLTGLVCSYNSLSELNISNCASLTALDCNSNRMAAAALNAVYSSLPNRNASDNALLTATGNPGYASSNRAAATAKGWTMGE